MPTVRFRFGKVLLRDMEADLKALQLFDHNTRQRLEACRLKNGENIEERIFYRNRLPIHKCVGGVVPLRGNPELSERISR